ETLIRWHRQGFKLLWRWKSRPGRPPISYTARRLIAKMARENPLWGEERIASELFLKTGLEISPRTVRKYMPRKPKGLHRGSQRWSTFVRNHAKAITACDFTTAVTARFQVLYIFVIMEIGSRRILHANVTANPTAEWTLQQFREALPWEHDYRWLIHDRDSIFSQALDDSIEAMPLTVLKTPFRAPLANAFCERLIGTLRRECLDHIIPMSDTHLRVILKEWIEHYNRGRPHSSLGPGLPDPPAGLPVARQ
ncbi:MAG: transposase, partial [Herbaspirillum sp.]|uniref:integrase core domain-containing protein n=1 Tax=Herbaspirillum sp. TaxID=1890675 RepID=UPI00258EF9F4